MNINEYKQSISVIYLTHSSFRFQNISLDININFHQTLYKRHHPLNHFSPNLMSVSERLISSHLDLNITGHFSYPHIRLHPI